LPSSSAPSQYGNPGEVKLGMKNAIHIERLTVDNWLAFKKIRLESFATDPQAFHPRQVAEAATYSEEKWKEYMTKRNATVLVARNDKKIVGLIGSYKESEEITVIWGTYVNQAARGNGIGKMLLNEIIKRIKTDKGTKKIKLWVGENQSAAMSLYKQFGFAIVGQGNVHLIMEKPLQ
jgi:ribosomal protein S18 acetylase RimI-like enzyme